MSSVSLEEKKMRWNSFDCMKGIACIAIVLIHYNFPGNLGLAVKAFCRFGVPVFFITSGFFFLYNGKMDDVKTINKIRHIFNMALWSGGFYACFAIFENMFFDSNWNVKNFIVEKITADRIVKLFITNDPFVYSHLWFLLALLYCYIFALLFWNKERYISIAMMSAPILVVMHNILQEFRGMNFFKTSFAIPGTEGRIYLFNLFVFRALPFFICGMLLRKYSYVISKLRFNKIVQWILFLMGGTIAVFERFTFSEDQFFVGNYIMVIALCLYAIKYPENENRVLKYIGKELSLYVYIFHIAVGKVFDMISGCLGVKETMICQYSRALIILVVTLSISIVINKVKNFYALQK